jgi:cytochrome c556
MQLIRFFSISVVVSLLGMAVVSAQDAKEKEPTAEEKAVAYRQDVMHVVAAQRGVMRDMADGKRPTDVAAFTNAANALAAVARVIPDAFTKNAMTSDSTAKPDVWTDQADFAAKANALADKGGELAKLAATDIDAAKVMAKDIKECGGCHDKYRVED